jgi:quercetin dioxygenase-like cupin family protein
MPCWQSAAQTGRHARRRLNDTPPERATAGAAMAFACTIPATPTVQQDDDTLRITRWDFEPGAVTGWHSHGWPYFVVMLVAGTLRIHDGKTETDVPLAQGQAYMRPAGIQHDVMNGSAYPIAFVEIEVKQPRALKELSLP